MCDDTEKKTIDAEPDRFWLEDLRDDETDVPADDVEGGTNG